jgi:ATP-dependent Lon protease
LLDIEAVKFVGSGKIIITGKLGEVMKESAQIALSYVRSIADELKIPAKEFNKYDFHVHVPEGATPKDGPSAGIALCSALVSSITNMPINKNIAMTGEITLTGKVLPIGGLKEKLLAALRGNIKTVLIPKDNEKDLEDIPQEVKDGLAIKTVSSAKLALKEALIGY